MVSSCHTTICLFGFEVFYLQARCPAWVSTNRLSSRKSVCTIVFHCQRAGGSPMRRISGACLGMQVPWIRRRKAAGSVSIQPSVGLALR
jgi:hypothetical protein